MGIFSLYFAHLLVKRSCFTKIQFFVSFLTTFWIFSSFFPVITYRQECLTPHSYLMPHSLLYFFIRSTSLWYILPSVLIPSFRAIGRILSCTPANVLNRVMRFSRQTAAVGAEILSQVTLEEDLVIDGFESYVESKWGNFLKLEFQKKILLNFRKFPF